MAAETKDAAQARALVGGHAAASGSSLWDHPRVQAEERRRRRGARRRAPPTANGNVWARIGTALTVLAFGFHLGGAVTRGISPAGFRGPTCTSSPSRERSSSSAVYLVVLFRYDLRFLGSLITGLVVLLLGGATLAFYVEIVPLADPLKSVWLVIHVFVASLATALRSRIRPVGGCSSCRLVASARRSQRRPTSERVRDFGPGFLRTLPIADKLESLAYRFAILGFIFWTFTLIAGSIWANDAWGRYWGFDTKEVWTFVIWVLYAGYITRARRAGGAVSRSAWLSIIGFAAVMFNFTIVNMFFKGLHVYSGLS